MSSDRKTTIGSRKPGRGRGITVRGSGPTPAKNAPLKISESQRNWRSRMDQKMKP